MNVSLTQKGLSEFLLTAAPVRPVFIWGPPGAGKSSIVSQLANDLGMECVSLLGSQLAPEDIIGVPQIANGVSKFCPPSMIARSDAYCLFLDELNACSNEVQKAFYSLIHERRIGEYHLPRGSIVIGAGNRAHDGAIVKQMSSALTNRLVHVHLRVSSGDWLEWARKNQIHELVLEYISNRPDHLFGPPQRSDEPFSTPRSWHMLSDNLHEFSSRITHEVLAVLTHGCLTPSHASTFLAFYRQVKNTCQLASIMNGEQSWPNATSQKELLYFLTQSFRAHLIAELPEHRHLLCPASKELARTAKQLIRDLSSVSLEMTELVVSEDEDKRRIPKWIRDDLARFLPELSSKKGE